MKLRVLGVLIAMGLNFFSQASVKVTPEGKCQIEHVDYPAVGFGTYPFKDTECLKAVTAAYASGYRIIDTATFYDNFESIRDVLKKHKREQFYLISKVWPDCQTRQGLEDDLKTTLKRLGTSYLDAYLLHWPNHQVPI